MSPITKRRIAALLILVLPVSAWVLIASNVTGVWFSHWNWRLFFELAYATPSYPPSYIWPGLALLIAFILIIIIGKGMKTEGLDGPEYKTFVRGSRVVSAKRLRKLRHESDPQINVGTIPMPIQMENL